MILSLSCILRIEIFFKISIPCSKTNIPISSSIKECDGFTSLKSKIIVFDGNESDVIRFFLKSEAFSRLHNIPLLEC